MKTVKGLLGAAVIAASVASLPANALEMGATDKAIKLAINEWTGQHLSTRVAGAILERAGYTVEYVTAGYGPQFIALGEGDLSKVTILSHFAKVPSKSAIVLTTLRDHFRQV